MKHPVQPHFCTLFLPVRVRIVEKWVTQALGLVRIYVQKSFTFIWKESQRISLKKLMTSAFLAKSDLNVDNRAFRLIVRSSFDFASSNCDLFYPITVVVCISKWRSNNKSKGSILNSQQQKRPLTYICKYHHLDH